jgi:hypothetical protein
MLAVTPSPAPASVVVKLVGGGGAHVTLTTFLLGVATVVLANAFIQLVVVPRAEQGKRADDRWERDVRELVDLLGQPMTKHAAEARAAGWFLFWWISEAVDVPEERFVSKAREYRESVAIAEDVWQSDCQRVEWLCDLVVARAPTRLSTLHMTGQRQRIRSRLAPSARGASETDRVAAQARLQTWDKEWDAERDARAAMLAEVKRLALSRVFHTYPGEARLRREGGRILHKWRQVRGRSRQRKSAKINAEKTNAG